jgi:6,7-dimethyl-8-ribityllumazine synthase
MEHAFNKIVPTKANEIRPVIIASKTHDNVVSRVLDGALNAFKTDGLNQNEVTIGKVAGALEIPLLLEHYAQQNIFNVFVVLGVVLKGETDHYYHVSRLANDGVMSTALKYTLALGNGILCVHNTDQALKRSDESSNNVGFLAATAALSLYNSFLLCF